VHSLAQYRIASSCGKAQPSPVFFFGGGSVAELPPMLPTELRVGAMGCGGGTPQELQIGPLHSRGASAEGRGSLGDPKLQKPACTMALDPFSKPLGGSREKSSIRRERRLDSISFGGRFFLRAHFALDDSLQSSPKKLRISSPSWCQSCFD